MRLNTWLMSECCFFDAEESINVHVFVMLKKEELKELGTSFGGRKVLEKLMEEIRLQAMKHKGRCVNCQHSIILWNLCM